MVYVLKSDPRVYVVMNDEGKVTSYSGGSVHEAPIDAWDVYPNANAAFNALNKPFTKSSDLLKSRYDNLIKAGRSEEVARRASGYTG